MCFYISLSLDPQDLMERFGVELVEPEKYQQFTWVSGFSHPDVPIITAEEPGSAKNFRWGLVPHWVKDDAQADEIRKRTLNARGETVFEKPSFRGSIGKKRCLVPVTGFFEWRHMDSGKFPYFIRMKDEEPFALAGIYETWDKGEEIRDTFSIITTEANPLMEMIHNSKKRMPVILPKADEKRWIDPELDIVSIQKLIKPLDEGLMDAYPIRKTFKDTRGLDALEKASYPELAQRTLF